MDFKVADAEHGLKAKFRNIFNGKARMKKKKERISTNSTQDTYILNINKVERKTLTVFLDYFSLVSCLAPTLF